MKQMKSLKNFLLSFTKIPKGLEESMKGSELVFHSVDLLHYKCLKISLNCSISYIDSPKQLRNKNKNDSKNKNKNKNINNKY